MAFSTLGGEMMSRQGKRTTGNLRLAVPAMVMAVAATGAAAQIEEVIVTAQKREERLQEVPIAVTAFDASALGDRSMVTVGDVARFTPGLVQTSGSTGGNDGFYFIRGVGQADFTAVQDPGVATYIDGVYLGRTSGANFDMLDVERIEVLRGPQGTLFGRNAVGGAINVISADPSGEFGGKLLLRGGSRERLDAAATVDVPLIRNVIDAKLSALTRNQEGWGDRVIDGGTMGDIETVAGRLKLVWHAGDRLDMLFSLDYTDANDTNDPMGLVEAQEGRNGFCVAPIPPFCVPDGTSPTGFRTLFWHTPLGAPLPNEAVMGLIGAAPASGINSERFTDLDRTFVSVHSVYDLEVWGISGTIDVELGPVRVRSITSYRDMDQHTSGDFDAARFVAYDQNQFTVQDQISQELQVSGLAFDGRLDWIGGLYLFKEESDQVNAITLGGAPLRGAFGSSTVNNQNILVDVTTYAVFGQGTFDLTPEWSFTGGIRYSYEEKETTYDFLIDNRSGNAVFIQGGFFPPGVSIPWPSFGGDIIPGAVPNPTAFPLFGACPAPFLDPDGPGPAPPIVFACAAPGFVRTLPVTTLRDDWESFIGRAALEWQPHDGLLAYASWSRGFKSGGFNSRPIVAADITSFDPEILDTFELGIKADWWNRRLRTNVTGYYSDYRDKQLLVASLQPGQFFIIENAGDVDLWGIELEAVAVPAEPLRLELSVSWNDNEYSRLSPEALASGITKDMEQPNLPEWMLALGAQYTWPVADLGEFTLRGDWYYQSDAFFGSVNTARSRQDSYDVLNLRGTFRTADGRWSLSVFGLNALDEQYRVAAQDTFTSFGTAFFWPSRPAEWGIEASFEF